MRLHVVNLPHTNTTKDYSWCAYTQKVRKFCDMMTGRGHEVILYGGSETEANVTEFVPIGAPDNDPLNIPDFGAHNPLFSDFNKIAIKEMTTRVNPRDFICLIAGTAQQEIAYVFPELMAVEYGVGYSGVFSKYRVYESYAWMHMLYGASADPHAVDGRFYDAVIPNYFDTAEFQFNPEPEDYYLYLGRLIDRKGWRLAVEGCEKLDKPLVIAGPGDPGELPDNCIYIGTIGSEQRDLVLGKALATFTPSLYVEPFCGVHVESMLCGTPVITTDWGVFPETVTDGKQGYRCRTFRQFCEAALAAPSLNRRMISRYARGRFTTEVIAPLYDDYFRRLESLWEQGFYQ